MLTTSVERLEGTDVKLTVTVPAADVDKCISEAYSTISGKMRIPGFRKGKAPRPVIDNYVGRDYVLTEATEALVNEWYPRAVDAEKLRPIESPELDAIDVVQAGEDYTFTLEVTLRPELHVESYDGITVTVPRREVTDADIDAELDTMRERYASLGPVEGRGIQVDDYVLLSFVGHVNGEEYEGNTVDKYLYEMGKGLMPTEFEDSILGLEAGAETHVEFSIPDTSSNPDYVGKTAEFDVSIHEIKARVLPEVDDDFAAELGFETAEALRTEARGHLDRQRQMAYNQAKEKGAREVLASRTSGEIPEAMIKARAQSLETDFKARLEQQGLTLEQYAQMTNLTRESFDEQMTKDAEEQVREDLALEALFRQLDFEVTDEDVASEIEDIASASHTTAEETRAKWESMGLTAVLAEGVMHRRAVGWLMENVTAVEEDESASTESDEAAGTKKPTKKRAPKKKDEAPAEASDAAPTEESAE